MSSTYDLPWISVITVVRNGESYIEKTIRSVLSQTYPRIDFLIIDGNSSDGTIEIIKKFDGRLRWISEPDNGIYDAMNKGILASRGEWLNFLNGGDSYLDKNTLTALFEKNELKGIDFIYGDSVNVIDEKSRYIQAKEITKLSLRKYLGLCHQAVFVKKELSPMYDLTYRYKAEYNWIIDIVEKIDAKNILHVKIPVVYYALGGFSEKGFSKNLREFISLTYRRYGFGQVILNGPFYLLLLLRGLKYKSIGY